MKSFSRQVSAGPHVALLSDFEALIERVVEEHRKYFPKVAFKLPWREAGPPNHHDDKVDSDQ